VTKTETPKISAKFKGNKVQMTALVPVDIYEVLKSFKDPHDDRWESALLRRIVSEWLQFQGGYKKQPVEVTQQAIRDKISKVFGGK